MKNLFNKIFSEINIISFLLGLVCYTVLNLILHVDTSITAVSLVAYTIITFFILITAISAKNTWKQEQKLKIYQKVFESLVNIINWLNDFYDFTIDEKSYNGQKAYELPFTGKNYDDKKKFIIHGCKGAFSYFEKVGLAMNKLFIFNKTEEELKKYCAELKDIFEDLQQIDKKTKKVLKRNKKDKSPYLELESDNNELEKIKTLIYKDLGIKDELNAKHNKCN